MSELSEMVFENLRECKLSELVQTLLSPQLSTATFNGHDVSKFFRGGLVRSYISNMQDGDSIFLNTHRICNGGINVSKCSAQIIKYEGEMLDLSLIFCVEDIIRPSGDSLSLTLRDFAREIAEVYEVENFYGGLEPAYDKETQYFFRTKLGPMAEFT